jgi:NAD(P)-dependent dehydrogenase (short-subunit alcohol dehydrogenase family)
VTVVVLTGATRGIGRAAAIELARRGADVVLVGRDAERVRLVAKETTTAGGGGRVHGHVSDLSLMSNVRMLADEIRGHHEHVDVLANNAGALFASRKETSEGLERTFALNHLAPFLLTNLLRDRLAGGRVVTTASGAHRSGRLDLDDLQSEKAYSPRVYGTSKLCNILFTRELARRAPELNANCFHPGVVRTGFAKNENGIWKAIATLGAPFLRSPERGAHSLVWLALSDDAAALTGKYIEDEQVVTPSDHAHPGRQTRTEPVGTKRPARQPACRRARLTPRRRDPLLSSLRHPAPDPPESSFARNSRPSAFRYRPRGCRPAAATPFPPRDPGA